jgi:soluble lytic murein transglycosylase-like protein
MRKSLKLAFLTMATAAIATLLSVTPLTPCVQAATDASITPTTDNSGHKVYTNDELAPAPKQSLRSRQGRAQGSLSQNNLVFWSTTEHRWKPVPHANVRAAKSAAAEVDQYLGEPSPEPSHAYRTGFTPEQVDAAIDKAATRHNVDPNLVRALVKVESNFNPNAVSRKGAMGLMQLMPQTARQLKVTNPFNPDENIDAGVRHLKRLLDTYGGNVQLSLAAYNAGSGAVARSAGIPHYAETRNYVKRITTLYGGNLGIGSGISFSQASREPIKVQRDARGVLYISNTD